MRNLLALILLVVFTLQATTIVVVEEHASAKDRVGFVAPAADGPAAPQDGLDTTEDDTRLSWNAIEELSDFMPFEPPIPAGSLLASLISPPGTTYLSTDLQGLKPPPRA